MLMHSVQSVLTKSCWTESNVVHFVQCLFCKYSVEYLFVVEVQVLLDVDVLPDEVA